MAVKIEEITTISYLSELYVPPSNFLIKPLLAVAKKILSLFLIRERLPVTH